jgi:CheY-like chemotaxis protein
VHVLHVEDDELCIMGLARAFERAQAIMPLLFAHDGMDALDMLRGTNGREPFPRPFVILLDLRMPRMDGIEFLKELRQDEDLKTSIVFVMTTSDAERDIVQAYDLGVAGYILKTKSANVFMEATKLLDSYCRLVEFPTGQ